MHGVWTPSTLLRIKKERLVQPLHAMFENGTCSEHKNVLHHVICMQTGEEENAPLFSIGVTLLITENDYLMKAVTIRQTWSALSGEAEGQIKQIQDSEFSTTSTESVRDNFRPVLLMWRDICGALGHCFPMLHCIRTRRDQWAWPVQGIRTSRFNHIW